MTHVSRVVKPHIHVEVINSLYLSLGKIEVDMVEILRNECRICGLWDDNDALLRRPPQEDFSRSPAVSSRDFIDGPVFKE